MTRNKRRKEKKKRLATASMDRRCVTYQPSPSPAKSCTRIGTLIDDLPNLKPLQDMPTDEDIRHWRHGDDEEDEATVQAILDAEDPQEAFKQCLHCGGAYVEMILDD